MPPAASPGSAAAEPSKELLSSIDTLGDKIKALKSELSDLEKQYAQMTKSPETAKKSIKELIKMFGAVDKAVSAAAAAADALPPLLRQPASKG